MGLHARGVGRDGARTRGPARVRGRAFAPPSPTARSPAASSTAASALGPGALMDLLGEVDAETDARRGIMIASLVVRADSGMPGEGYFVFAAEELGRPIEDRRAFWEREVERVWAAYAPLGDGGAIVSRADAIAVLRPGAPPGSRAGWRGCPASCSTTSQPQPVSATRAQALAVAASSVPVDLAFVGASGRDGRRLRRRRCTPPTSPRSGRSTACSRASRARSAGPRRSGMTAAEPGALADRLDEALHDALVAVRAAFEAGADAVLIGDDLAGPAGPLLSPDFALDALMPCYQRLALEVAAGGLPAIFHSDGDIRDAAAGARARGLLGGASSRASARTRSPRRRSRRAASGSSVLGGIAVAVTAPRVRAKRASARQRSRPRSAGSSSATTAASPRSRSSRRSERRIECGEGRIPAPAGLTAHATLASPDDEEPRCPHPLRREDRAITDPAEIDRILSEARFATSRLADGDEPYVVTLSCGYDARAVAVCASTWRRRAASSTSSRATRARAQPWSRTSATRQGSARTRSSRW